MAEGPLAAAYRAACERFNAGDTAGFGEILADDCVFEGSRGRVGSSRAEIVAAVSATREALGWQRHELMQAMEEADLLVGLARNTFGSGEQFPVGGVMRFRNGKIIEMRAAGGMAGV
ncbi:MAG: nuclear transport factor 2 family protein [Acidimicrobiia bacterium]